jgi:hypothetical protein
MRVTYYKNETSKLMDARTDKVNSLYAKGLDLVDEVYLANHNFYYAIASL